MTPYEIMLSESQERMLLVVEQGPRARGRAVFEKWDLHAVQIGDGHRGRSAAHLRARQLVADVPNARADRRGAGLSPADAASPAWQTPVQQLRSRDRSAPPRLGRRTRSTRCSPRPSIASKRWAYRQYDHTVGTNTIAQPGASARRRAGQGHRARARGVGRLQRPLLLSRSVSRRDAGGGRIGAQRGVRRRRADRRDQQPELRQPRAAGDHVAARARPFAASATPAARSTFRSPAATSASTTRPRARRSIRRRCSASSGCIEDATAARCTRPFKAAGAHGACCSGIIEASSAAASTWRRLHGIVAGHAAGAGSRRASGRCSELVVRAIREGLVESAHDCAEGGLAVTLAECCFDTAASAWPWTCPRSAMPPGPIQRRCDAVRRVGLARRRVGRAGAARRACSTAARRCGRAGGDDRRDRRRSHPALGEWAA